MKYLRQRLDIEIRTRVWRATHEIEHRYESCDQPRIDLVLQRAKTRLRQDRFPPRTDYARVFSINSQRFRYGGNDECLRVLGVGFHGTAGSHGREFKDESIHEHEQRLSLRTKMQIERADGDFSTASDLGDRRRFVTVLFKRRKRRSQQRLAGAATTLLTWSRRQRFPS